MRVASVCSSVGGLDLGLHRAGHETVFLCEVDPWRRKVLARHFPGVPIHHDLTTLTADDIPECDLLVGGTPCQDLSVAGKRAGLDGERSGLFWKFAQLRIDLFERYGTAWSLWENVAGALSSNEGADFSEVLAAHVGADVPVPAGGWNRSGMAAGAWGASSWRLLDAQHFGVPQRRRRVFVVGHIGADRPVEVLADTARRGWHSPASGEARPDAPAGPAHSTGDAGRVAHTLTAGGFDASEDGTGRGTPIIASALDTMQGGVDDNDAQARHIVAAPQMAATLTSGKAREGTNPAGRRQEDDYNVVAFHVTQDPISGEISPALGTTSTGMGVHINNGGPSATDETDPREVLRALCEATGAETLREATRGLGRLQAAEVLRQGVHGARLRGETEEGQPRLDDGALPRPADQAAWAVREVRRRGQDGRASRQRELARQLARELDAFVQELPPAGAQRQPTTGVRRLTPTEAERLMGWPDGWTLDAGPSLADTPQSWPGGAMPNDPAPDGRRYSACGDGVVAHVAEWIGLGFAAVQPSLFEAAA